MDDFDIGKVHEIGSSGKAWMGYNSRNIADLLFEELSSATKSIQISSFSIGNDTDVLRDFFKILETKLHNGKGDPSAKIMPTFEVSMIINDDGTKKSIPKATRVLIKKGNKVLIQNGGGGGYGHPSERQKEKVLDDYKQEYISKEYINKYYPEVVLND